jgi:hypothetical protein
MGGRAVRALTGPRLTRHRLIRHRDRCRFAAVAVTPLHTHNVKPTPDNPDLLARPTQRVVAAHTSGLWSLSYFSISSPGAPLSIIKQHFEWTSTSILSAGLRPATHGMGLTPDLKSGACGPKIPVSTPRKAPRRLTAELE